MRRLSRSIQPARHNVHAGTEGRFIANFPHMIGAAVTLQNDVYFPKDKYKEDFSKSHVYDQSWLVHEVGHVWQHQTNPKYSTFKAAMTRTYDYELKPGKKLLDYGWEQQASILADTYQLGKGYSPSNLEGLDKLTPEQVRGLGESYQQLLAPHGLGQQKEETKPPVEESRP